MSYISSAWYETRAEPSEDPEMKRQAIAIAAVLTVASCTKTPETANNRDTMTRRQKDSVLAQSSLPGAGGVGMALRTADSLKAKQAALDSAARP
jgi:uncharacterized lipoprotein YajG